MEEIWRDIEGYEGLYQVSNLGRVKSNYNKNRKTILKNRVNRGRYFTVLLYKNKRSKNFSVHRLVALTFIPNPENKTQVNHIDGNKLNNRAKNLEWVTASENQIHAYATGLQPKPEDRDKGRKKVKCLENKIIFKSLREAGLYMGNKEATSYISKACNGKLKTAYGYHWEFVGEDKCQ